MGWTERVIEAEFLRSDALPVTNTDHQTAGRLFMRKHNKRSPSVSVIKRERERANEGERKIERERGR